MSMPAALPLRSDIPQLVPLTVRRALKVGAVYLVEAPSARPSGGRVPYVVKCDGISPARRGRGPTTETTKDEARQSIAFLLRVYRAVCTFPSLRVLTPLEETQFIAAEATYTAGGESAGPLFRQSRVAFYAMPLVEGLYDLGHADALLRERAAAAKAAASRSRFEKLVDFVRRPAASQGAEAGGARPGSLSSAAQVRWIFGQLNDDPTLFQEMGRILVADTFAGNSDRFKIDGELTAPVPDVMNWGNFFFLTHSNDTKALMCGLDFVDPGPLSNLFGSIAGQRDGGAAEWRPEFLVDSAREPRAALARAVIHMWKGYAGQLGIGARFQPGKAHEAALLNGMEQGCRALKAFYATVRHTPDGPDFPPAARERFVLLRYE